MWQKDRETDITFSREIARRGGVCNTWDFGDFRFFLSVGSAPSSNICSPPTVCSGLQQGVRDQRVDAQPTHRSLATPTQHHLTPTICSPFNPITQSNQAVGHPSSLGAAGELRDLDP